MMARKGYCFHILLLVTLFLTSTYASLKISQNTSSNLIRKYANTSSDDPWNRTCNDSVSGCNREIIASSAIRTMQEFCRHNNISQINCSCEKSTIVCKEERWIRYERLEKDYSLVISVEVIIVMVFGVVGNSAVLLSSFQRRHQLSTNKIVITFLALTDGISSVINFIHTWPYIWTDKIWKFGVPICKIINTGLIACSWLSSGFILLIGVERYCGILYPLRKDLHSKKTMYRCVATNIFVVLCAGVPMFVYTTVNLEGNCQVTAGGDIMIPYQWALIVLFMITPMSAVVFIYFRIILHLHRLTHDNAAVSERTDIQLRRVKENRRAMMILLPVVAAFVICVLPVNIIDLYFAYFNVDGILWMNPFVYLDLWLVYNLSYPVHACANPIIYTCVDPEFRKSLCSVFGLRQRSNDQPPDQTMSRATSKTTI